MRPQTFAPVAVVAAFALAGAVGWALWPAGGRTDECDTLRAELAALPVARGGGGAAARGHHSRLTRDADAPRWVQVDLGAVRAVDEVVLFPAEPADPLAALFPARFRVEVADEPAFEGAVVIADHTAADVPDPGLYPVRVPVPPGVAVRAVRVTATRAGGRGPLHGFALAEVAALAGGANLAVGAAVTASDAAHAPPVWSPAYLTDGVTPLGPPVVPGDSPGNGFRTPARPAGRGEEWVEVDLGVPTAVDEVRLVPCEPRDFPDRPGYGFPLRYAVEGTPAKGGTPVVFADRTAADAVDPGAEPVCVAGRAAVVRAVRVRAASLRPRGRDEGTATFALAEVEVYANGRNVARGRPVAASASLERAAWGAAMLTDGFTSRHPLADTRAWLDGLDRRQAVEARLPVAEAERAAAERAAARRVGRVGVAAGAAAGLAACGWVGATAVRRRARDAAARRRLTRDLHDDVGANLGAVVLLTAAARESGGEGVLDQIEHLARECLAAVRDLAALSAGPADPGAVWDERWRDLAAFPVPGAEVRVDLPPAGWAAALPPPVARNLYLIAKEAVANAARHARPRSVSVRVARGPAGVTLAVADDGTGFAAADLPTGCGLRHMADRAAALGGTFAVESGPGAGTVVRAALPADRGGAS